MLPVLQAEEALNQTAVNSITNGGEDAQKILHTLKQRAEMYVEKEPPTKEEFASRLASIGIPFTS